MPDGAACSNAGSWRNPTSTILPAGSLSFSPDGQLLAILTAEWQKKDFQPVVYLRTTTTGKIVARISTDAFKDLYRHPPVLRFSPDCRFLAGLSSTSLCIWEMNHAAEAARIKGKKHFKDCVFLPDGRRLVTVSNDALVRVWRTDCWTETDAYEWKIGKLACVAVSPDGCLLAAGGSTGKIVLWDAV
ncbi:MAG: WD40 repeat domain-containing protein [Gemmataceae bacterium]